VRSLIRPDGTIAYELLGDERAPLVVCVPGMGDLRAEYRFLAPRLVDAGYRVATIDVRGHGESSTDFADVSAAAVGSDVVALLGELGPGAVVGTSMAAAAAVWAAAEAPQLVRAIVLCGPFVRDFPTGIAVRTLMAIAFARPWGAAAWSAYYKSLYPTSPPADLAAYRRRLRANLKERGRFDALKRMLAASKQPCEARIPEVKQPALVVMGSRDPDFKDPAAEGRLVADRLRGELLMVEGAGHYPHAEMPDVVAPAIVAFLKRLPAASP
jgi:pimeloyl-ACP methyl ester carboxylesterase